MMDKRFLRIFCFLKLIVLIYSAEYEAIDTGNQRAYDLDKLVKGISNNLRHYLHFKEHGSLDHLQFTGVDKDFEFRPSGRLEQNSSRCLGDILYILQNLKSQWALKLIDSFGKPESGILEGNFKWLGDYNECIGVRASNPNATTGNFNGKYCSVTWSLNFLNFSLPLPFSSGVCIPDSCSAEELEGDTWQVLHIAGIGLAVNDTESVLNKTSLTCKPNERHLNTPAKAVIALLSIFCALVVLGSSVTVARYFREILIDSKTSNHFVNIPESDPAVGDCSSALQKNNSDSDCRTLLQDCETTGESKEWQRKLETVLRCFCVFTNGAKILNTDASEGELLCIHGIRFLSMSWVILGHAYLTGFAQVANILAVPDLMKNFPFQIILQGFYSVDSFFVLSGFLLTYLTMKEFAKSKGSIAWPYFYIHRYIRLTPIYMVVLGFSATVYLYLGSGPYWPDNDLDPVCRDNWWRNLIYINNFSDQAQQCMAWSWYLANDMQFFVISPLFLITLWRWPKVGYSLIAIFLVACWTANFYITYHFDLLPGFSGIMSHPTLSSLVVLTKIPEFFNKLYIKPYTRIAPYLIGMLTGYLLFKSKASDKPKHSLVFLCIGWISASAITLTCVYGLYHSNPTKLANSFYNAFNRSGFALGLSWVIYVCLVGQGGFVNSILSWRLFIPLSRLTYAAYLIHPMILGGYFSSLKSSLVFTHATVVALFLGFMVVTYVLSLPVALMLESPIVSLEKLVRKFFVRSQKAEAVN